VSGRVVFEHQASDKRNGRLVVQADIREMAAQLASRAAANTPRRTGRMASAWRTAPGYSDPGTTVVINTTPYARYVEYGTRRRPARAPMGRAVAAGSRS
jgi:hypothetical protein